MKYAINKYRKFIRCFVWALLLTSTIKYACDLVAYLMVKDYDKATMNVVLIWLNLMWFYLELTS